MTEELIYICPTCGSEARVGKPCPGCPSTRTATRRLRGSETARLDEPSGDFDYEAFVEREFGKGMQAETGLKWYWWLLAAAVLGGMVAGVLGLR